ncbi:glycosyltransferase, partial [Nonomuraea lactucae]|uniref:glycosyltransferase n=1 Tax=Nonomuraea lactucae TaxID=2249762 RepID=UPI001965CA99
MRPIASVVIPAHNEEAVLGAGLAALLGGAEPGEFDVVVVANACSDRTAEVARAAGVRVVETPTGGKAGALRLGDAACRAFPRLYLDADV